MAKNTEIIKNSSSSLPTTKLTNKNDRINKLVDLLNASHNKSNKGESPNSFIKQASEHMDELTPKFLSTGVMQVDDILGGGLVKGSIILLAGSPGCGKTALSLCCSKQVTDEGGSVLYFNLEPPFPTEVAFNKIGVNPEKFFIIDSQQYSELGIDGIESLLYDPVSGKTQGVVDLVIIDSINNIVGKKEIDKLIKEGAEGNNMAVQSLVLGNLLKRLQGLGMLRDGTVVILIAQMRANFDNASGKGPKEKIGASSAAKFNPKTIIQLTKTAPINEKVGLLNQEIGHTVRCRVIKNNNTGRLGTTEYTIIRGKIDDSGRLSQLGQEYELIIPDNTLGRAYYRFCLNLAGAGFEKDIIVKGKATIDKSILMNDIIANALRSILKLGKPKSGTIIPSTEYELYDPTKLAEVSEDEDEE